MAMKNLIGILGKEDAIRIIAKKLGYDGGPGSGNFGHAGRPGKVGGSGPGGGSQYRVQNTKGKYEGIHKAKAFKSIARQARSAKDVKSFVDSFSKEQYDMFMNQYHSLGTKEGIWKYTERVYNLMRSQKPERMPAHKIVEGKDISQNWDGLHGQTYTDPATGQLIDEDIEDAMYKQGFLGMPKVVTQEELDRIIKEHPEMPILFRSFTGATPEQAQDFDDMLEHGEWYVDCDKGGAGYGQGMYCAGVYPKEPLYKWDDPELDHDFQFMDEMGKAGTLVFTDKKGNGFVTKERVTPEENGDLYTNTPYIIVKEDGSRQMAMLDHDSLIWEDMNTGAMIAEEDMDKILNDAKAVYECKEQDLGIYRDAYTKEREQGIKGALEEMEHYRSLGIQRIQNETTPEPPDGMLRASSGLGADRKYYYFDPEKYTSVAENPPAEGDVIVLGSRTNDAFSKYDKKPFLVHKGVFDGREGTLLSPVDKEDYMSTMFLEDIENDPDYLWTKIEGECEEPVLDPTPSTRMMTLDPSARIITHKELQNIKHKAYNIREEFKRQQERDVNDYLSGLPFEDAWAESKVFYVAMGQGTGNITREQIKRIAEYKKTHPERMEKLQKFVDEQIEKEKAMKREAGKYDRLSYLDEGVIATLLGYDAINAEGHGASDSYTVVLNRTKLIISEQRVDVRR